jgi:lipid-A-disaccharide synthase-like uncharacterized protein
MGVGRAGTPPSRDAAAPRRERTRADTPAREEISMPAFLDPATWTVWTAIGFLGQGMFFSRFAVQWLVSERRGESHIPVAFWWLSLAGSLVTLAYALHRRDPVFVLGQAFGWMVYSRNLVLIYRGRGVGVRP